MPKPRVYGFKHDEDDRMQRLASRVDEEVWFPLSEPPLLGHEGMVEHVRSWGIEPPRLYGVSAQQLWWREGQGMWKLLWEKMPERYLWWEDQERRIREYLGKNVTIIRYRTTKIPVTLEEFRKVRGGGPYGLWGRVRLHGGFFGFAVMGFTKS